MIVTHNQVSYLVRLPTADTKGSATDSSISARIVGSKAACSISARILGIHCPLTAAHLPTYFQVPYMVRLLTADTKGSATDSSISARIVGSKADSGWQPLLANHDTLERGQVRLVVERWFTSHKREKNDATLLLVIPLTHILSLIV